MPSATSDAFRSTRAGGRCWHDLELVCQKRAACSSDKTASAGSIADRLTWVRHASLVSRVLVVDDEVNLRKLLAAMLRREGYDVAVASDGEQALAEFERTAPMFRLSATKTEMSI